MKNWLVIFTIKLVKRLCPERIYLNKENGIYTFSWTVEMDKMIEK